MNRGPPRPPPPSRFPRNPPKTPTRIGDAVCTVVVPHDQSAGSIAKVQAEAAAAEAFYREFQTAPAGYALLGEGPARAHGNGSPNATVSLAGLGQPVSASLGLPVVQGGAVTGAALPTAPVSRAVQPDQPFRSWMPDTPRTPCSQDGTG
jgi:hypothetical protein